MNELNVTKSSRIRENKVSNAAKAAKNKDMKNIVRKLLKRLLEPVIQEALKESERRIIEKLNKSLSAALRMVHEDSV
jgi:uncharacterized membrane protein YheB (UPF0754 family)